jgi:hypothetical protein
MIKKKSQNKNQEANMQDKETQKENKRKTHT